MFKHTFTGRRPLVRAGRQFLEGAGWSLVSAAAALVVLALAAWVF